MKEKIDSEIRSGKRQAMGINRRPNIPRKLSEQENTKMIKAGRGLEKPAQKKSSVAIHQAQRVPLYEVAGRSQMLLRLRPGDG